MNDRNTRTTICSRTLGLVLHLLVVFGLSLGSAHADNWSSSVSATLGHINIQSKDWITHNHQKAIALMMTVDHANWPVGIAIDLIGSGDEKNGSAQRHEFYTAAMHIGLRKDCPLTTGMITPYIGGGLALVNVELNRKEHSGESFTQEDSGSGLWLGAGTQIALSGSIQLVLDVRYSNADVVLNNTTRDAGGIHSSLGIGYHW